jgi:hypothetical protein
MSRLPSGLRAVTGSNRITYVTAGAAAGAALYYSLLRKVPHDEEAAQKALEKQRQSPKSDRIGKRDSTDTMTQTERTTTEQKSDAPKEDTVSRSKGQTTASSTRGRET